MVLWARRRRPAGTWVAPPELHTGLVAMTDGAVWRVACLNAADGVVPAPPPPRGELTGAWLAEEFRASWRAAGLGRRGAPSVVDWITMWPGAPADADRGTAWSAFFGAGGAMFRVRTRPRDAIEAHRWCWTWPETGQEVVQVGLRAGDALRVLPDPRWREEIDTAGWATGEYWAQAASWMREFAMVDARYAVWWMADEQGRPVSPMVEPGDIADTILGWLGGHWPATGTAVTGRYRLPVPAGEPVRFAFLRWDPGGGARQDGLADVLGLRRVGRDLVEVLWWQVRPDGEFGPPRRARLPGGAVSGGLDPDRLVEVGMAAVTAGRVPTGVDWVEAP